MALRVRGERPTVRVLRGRATVGVVILFTALLALLPLDLASAATGDDADVFSPESGAYFGSTLDWSSDGAADQAQRLGGPSAVYAHDAFLPLSDGSISYLSGFATQTAEQGSLPAISLAPGVDLSAIDDNFADEVASDIATVLGDPADPVYVSFAPDMNSTWQPWGQQPSAYRAAFTTLADAIHRELPGAMMVWSPTWGGGYPFAAASAATGARQELDTNLDGTVDGGDDPYSPYYPGDAAVDWVGLSLYHDDSDGGTAVNTVPAPGELADRLGPIAGTAGTDPAAQFYARYAEGANKPMMLRTAALYSPAGGGPSELAIKRAWWQQVFAAVGDDQYDQIDVVLWQDSTATRGAVGESFIDWSVTLNSVTRPDFVSDLTASELRLGPVVEAAAATGGSTGTTITGPWAWLVAAAVVLAALALTLRARYSRNRFRWAYSGPGNRDLRIDMLRGIAIVFVMVNHIGLTSIFQNGTQEAIGVVSGAELFVLFSGAVIGMVYRPKVVAGGIGEVVIRSTRRAWKLYYTAVTVVLIVFAASRLPFIDAGRVTTFTDQGSGAAGSSASGRVYNLYTNAEQLLGYPVNPQIVVDVLSLRLGPWQFNVMGLYVVLLLLSPLVLWALSRGWWMPVLAVSGSLYVLDALTRFRLLPSQFEDSFPLLSWQLLFVLGMVGGYFRRELVRWFRSRAGAVVLTSAVLVAVALMLFSWSNPYLSSPQDVRLSLISDNAYRGIYAAFFERTYVEPGRLLNVVLVVVAGYALLSAYWKPIAAATAWFFVPLGQATLYVFIMHIFFALIVSNVPALREGSVWLNSIAYLVLLAVMWVMVKTKFLFRIVPR
ncbi:hypothetical protein B0I08_105305 [Glaciihabitans tibetensis]|uniref:GH26 domain-containing protein n=1 Tax=Glaciihabitans tibetensis TaxID=1266600 RepID=A0A2T0VD85_9MICO|nr:OpgC domain-containing protein [Glaciihabitans tibetensis]PRY68140.1 hypothetical protein B0I08_105305 [Glaciihabitans tibetensis]